MGMKHLVHLAIKSPTLFQLSYRCSFVIMWFTFREVSSSSWFFILYWHSLGLPYTFFRFCFYSTMSKPRKLYSIIQRNSILNEFQFGTNDPLQRHRKSLSNKMGLFSITFLCSPDRIHYLPFQDGTSVMVLSVFLLL